MAAPKVESAGYPCQLSLSDSYANHALRVETDSTSVVQYFDPEDCGYSTRYPFAITSFVFSLYDSLGRWDWPTYCVRYFRTVRSRG